MAEDLGAGEEDGVVEDEGALAGALGDEVGASVVSELALGDEAGDTDGEVFGDGEAVGEVEGAWAATPAMATKIRARTTTWRAILLFVLFFGINNNCKRGFLRLQ